MEAKNTLEYKMFFISFMFLNSKLRELKIPVSQCIKSLINDDINPKLKSWNKIWKVLIDSETETVTYESYFGEKNLLLQL